MGFENPTAPTVPSEESLSRSEKNLERKRERFAREVAEKSKTLGISPEEYLMTYADNEKYSRERTGTENTSATKKLFGLGNITGEALNRELHDKTGLQIELEHQKEIATRDPLTGLLNRRGFDDEIEKLQKEIRDAREQQKQGLSDRRNEHTEKIPPYYSVLFFDADHFKQVNDTYGHATGDIVLKKIAEILKNNVRTSEGFVARFGGEEMVVVLRTDINNACIVAERIRSDIQKVKFSTDNQEAPSFHVTVSIGIAPYEEDVKQQIATADTAVYAAKGHLESAETEMKKIGGDITLPESSSSRNQIWFVHDNTLSKYNPSKESSR